MKVLVYGKEDCTWCVSAKNLLDSKKIEYSYQDINVPGFSKIELMSKIAPGAKTVPVVMIDGSFIGGYTELQKYLQLWDADIQKARDLLKGGATISVVFIKKNGEKRIMHCTTNPEFIPDDKQVKGTNIKQVSKDLNLFTVFDVQKQEWRSFHATSIEKVV